MRLAIGGFGHETNTFASIPTSYEDFGDWLGGGIPRGLNMLERVAKSYSIHAVARAAADDGHVVLPTLHAFAPPGNRVKKDAFERISEELIGRIVSVDPDAIYLQLHGAMVSEHIPSGDAEVLRRLRAAVGGDVPMVVSFDLHGNFDPTCLDLADGIVAYRTYPHIDYLETGQRAYELLKLRLSVGRPLARDLRQINFMMPLHRQTTDTEPTRSIYAALANAEAALGNGSKLSFLTGFPPSDVYHNGPTLIGYGLDQPSIQARLDELSHLVNSQEHCYSAQLPNADDAVAAATSDPAQGMVVLADVQDNPGGGAGSDTTWAIRSLLAANAQGALVGLVFDPEAANAAHCAGLDAVINVKIGGRTEARDSPIELRTVVTGLHEGPFRLSGPMFRGSEMDLGKMAVLQHNGVSIVVVSKRNFYVERACFASAGAIPEDFRIVVIKSTNHYRADFAPVASRIIEFAAPAAVSMNPADYDFKHLRAGLRLFGEGPLA